MKLIDHATATEDDEFTEGNPGTGTPATRVTAQWLNVIQAELAKIVKMAGIALDQTGVDRDQVAKAMAVHVGSLDFYEDTGAADAYVLTATGSGDGVNELPFEYSRGLRARFIPDNSNSGACTARIGALAIKNIKKGAGAGSDPASGDITAGVPIELVFDDVNDCWKFAVSLPSPEFSKSYTSANQALTIGGLVSLSHGLGEVPKIIAYDLINVTADLNWSPGDVVRIEGCSTDAGLTRHNFAELTSTNINIRYSTTTSIFAVQDKTTGGYSPITNNRWELRVHAYA